MKSYLKTFLGGCIRRSSPIQWHNLRTVVPVSDNFGIERGLPIDRYYIEKFLKTYKYKIKGALLEVGDNAYIKKFGSEIQHTRILTYSEKKDDLTKIETLPKPMFDCIICTQTLQFIYDIGRAVKGLKHLLKPTGTLLVTLPSVSQISSYDNEKYGDYWRFTKNSVQHIFANEFSEKKIEIKSYGNLLSVISFLEGISAQELTEQELDFTDPAYPLLIGAAII